MRPQDQRVKGSSVRRTVMKSYQRIDSSRKPLCNFFVYRISVKKAIDRPPINTGPAQNVTRPLRGLSDDGKARRDSDSTSRVLLSKAEQRIRNS